MTLAPSRATLGTVKIDGTAIGGTQNVKFGDKNMMKDITSLGDNAKMQYPTIQEWSLSFDLVYDAVDAGQVKVFTSKANKTNLAYSIYLNATKYYACAGGYVESIDFSLEPSDITKCSVTIASHDTATYT